MRDLILKLHMYGGLLCSSYLIIFGLSALNYNHHFGKPGHEKIVWTRTVQVEDMDDDNVLAAAVRDSLGLIGWPLSWKTRRDERGDLRFELSRPGKKYTIHAFPRQNRVEVVEVRTGFWPVINHLHGLMRLPGSPFMSLWGIYTEVCVWVVLFSAASGVYLWTIRRSERLIGGLLLGSSSLLSLLFMLYVWIRG